MKTTRVTKASIETIIRAGIAASLANGKDGGMAAATKSGLSREGAWTVLNGTLGSYELRAVELNKHVCQKYPSKEIFIRLVGSAGKCLPMVGLHGAAFGGEYISAVARSTAERLSRGEAA